MDSYIVKDGKRLRLGYTTGSCAAAAAKAASFMLLSGGIQEKISLLTPKGITLDLKVEEVQFGDGWVRCGIQKDSGDDPDVTRGAYIYATVKKIPEGIVVDGGEGVGRVTKPGLDQPVGNAAINSVPRRMIAENVREIMGLLDYSGGLFVEISVPLGRELAKKTFNPRIGIEGGISILGTTGIVEPMSEKALVDTIRVELGQRRALGQRYVMLTPGNYGSEFIEKSLGISPGRFVQVSNFMGDALDICKELGFSGVLLIGHIGKLVKIGGGMLNTHSKYGDCRLEILAAMAAAEGATAAQIQKMLDCVSCDEGLRMLEEACRERSLQRLLRRISGHLQYRAGETLETGCAMFSKEYGLLGKTDNTDEMIRKIVEEE